MRAWWRGGGKSDRPATARSASHRPAAQNGASHRHGIRAVLALPAVAMAAVTLALAAGCTSASVDESTQDEVATQIVEDVTATEDATADEDVAAEEDAEATTEDAATEEPATLRETLDLSTLNFDAIPAATSELTTFSLTDAAAPELSADARAQIESALQTAGQLGSVSVVLVSCNTSVGIAYNTDVSLCGASSFKGPYVAYLCREFVEAGQISLATTCTVLRDDSNFSGTYGRLGASYTFQTLVEATILNSDNDAFRILHMNFDDLGYYDWLDATFGAGTVTHYGYFPRVTARVMAKAWAYVWTYLQTGSETATWLTGLYTNTGTSFIRDALASAGIDATVYNKAGWYGGDTQFNSTTDAGIVQIDGSTYLIAAVSDMSYGSSSAAALESVIQALVSAREALG